MPPRPGEALDASRHVDAVTVNVTVVKQDIAEIDPDAKFDPAIPLRTGVPRLHSPLDLDRAENCVFHGTKLHQHAITDELDDAPVMRGDRDVPQLLPVSHEGRKRALLVELHQPTIADHVRGHDDGELLFHRRPQAPAPLWIAYPDGRGTEDAATQPTDPWERR